MPGPDLPVDNDQAIQRLLRFLAIQGITGEEEAIGRDVVGALLEAGVPRKAIHFDRVHEQIPLPTQTGNLIVTLPGTRPGPRRLFSTHLDTVPLCAGAKPVRKVQRIVPAGQTWKRPQPLVAESGAIQYKCTIHPWMKCWLISFTHPYYAVTDEKGEFEIKNAPAGKYRLQIWHEGAGFVQKSSKNRGVLITIEDGKPTKVEQKIVEDKD